MDETISKDENEGDKPGAAQFSPGRATLSMRHISTGALPRSSLRPVSEGSNWPDPPNGVSGPRGHKRGMALARRSGCESGALDHLDGNESVVR